MEIADKKARNQVLIVLFIGVLMGALDIAIIGPALPAIQKSFGLGERAIGWIFTSYVLFNLIGTPLMAKLSDAYGRRMIYTADVILFAIGSLVVALSPGFSILLVGRAIQGFGAGGIFPVASAVIGDTFPPERQGGALGLIGAVFGLAFLIGPILGGVLLMFGWRWLFLINLPLALIVIFMSLRLLPNTRRPDRQPFDWAGIVTLGGALAALTYGLNQLDTQNIIGSLGSTKVWPFLLGTLILLVIFRLVERNAADPILRLSLFNSRQVIIASALAGGAGIGEAAGVFVPALLVAAFNVTNSMASFMLLPVVLAMAVGSPLAGRMLDKVGSKIVVIAGTAIATVGMALLGLWANNLIIYYVAAILIGLGLSALLGAPLRYIFLTEARETERAAAQGVVTLFTSVGQVTSAALVGAVAASLGGGVSGYEAAFLTIAVVSLGLSIISLGLKSHSEELETAQRHGPPQTEPAG